MNSRLLLPIMAVAVAGLGFFVAQKTLDRSSPAPGISGGASGTTISNSREGLAPFTLQNTDGSDFTLDDLKKNWSLIFFGYTHCPDVCPTTLADVRDGYKALTPESQAETQVLFVSVDPARDKPEHLESYTKYWHDDFIGLTGSEDQLQNITRQLYAVYGKIESGDPQSYEMDHSARIMLINPDAKLHHVFPLKIAPEAITAVVESQRKKW